MRDFLIAPLLVFLVLGAWLLVQAIARNFARSHPEFGPPREEGGGCGADCRCSSRQGCRR